MTRKRSVDEADSHRRFLESLGNDELHQRLGRAKGTIGALFVDEGPVTSSMTESYMTSNHERFVIEEILKERGMPVE